MNTQLNLKTRLFGPTFVTLLIGIVAVLALGSPTVQAQTTTASDAPVDSSITIPVKGSVSDSNTSVTVTGSVIVNSRMVLDTTSTVTPALVILDFDFSQLKATSGSKATLKTYTTGDNHANEIRPFQSADKIVVTIPYFDSATKDELSAKTMLATATLNFDITTGKLTSGTISVGNNVITSSAVGTISTAPIQ